MKKLVLFMHVSLDGFVGGTNGEMDWITVNDEIFDYAAARTNEADTALYGRVTYQMMESYWPTAAQKPGATKHDVEHSRWYSKVSKIVLSKTLSDKNLKNTHIVSGDITAEINKLKQGTGKDIIIFGSPTASHLLMAKDLIDDYWLFVNPVLLGKGIPLFKDIKGRKKLSLVKSDALSSGVVCLYYQTITGN